MINTVTPTPTPTPTPTLKPKPKPKRRRDKLKQPSPPKNITTLYSYVTNFIINKLTKILGAAENKFLEEEEEEDKKTKPLSSMQNYHNQLFISRALSTLQGSQQLSDVTLIVGKEKMEIPAHRVLLASRSRVLEKLLYPNGETGEPVSTLELPEIDPEICYLMLSCIYNDKVSLNQSNVFAALNASKTYDIDILRLACVEYMREGLTPETAIALFSTSPISTVTSLDSPSSPSLQLTDEGQSAFEYIEDNTELCIVVDGFVNLSKERLLLIVQSSSLCVKELNLFRAVEKWVKAECARLEKKETEENLQEIAGSIIKFIRFPLMTMQDVVNVVRPSNLLLKHQLLEIFTYLGAKHEDKPKISFLNEPRGISGITFTWSENRKHRSLIISNSGLTISCAHGSWHTCGGDVILDSGIHQWEVILESYSTLNGYNVCVGVIPSTFTNWSVASLVGLGETPGWIFITGQGKICRHTGSTTDYGMRCAQGDRVGVRLNIDDGTIEYFVNGTSLGVAFRDLPRIGFIPIICLVQHQRCTLNFDVSF